MYEAFIKKLEDENIEYKEAALSDYSTVKIGGKALCVFPKSELELIAVSKYLYRNNINHRILGAMSNTLAPSCGYPGAAVITRKLTSWHIEGKKLFAGTGVRLLSIVEDLIGAKLTGYEELVGIPGLVGGLVYENAGAFSKSVSDILVSARIYDKANDKIIELEARDMELDYRKSILSKNRDLVLLSVCFKLEKCTDPSVSARLIREYAEKRRSSQPIEYPSLGSVFKRPAAGFAGAYIENAGLKGRTVGDAEVSQKHAGFIINKGRATSEDFVDLIKIIKDEVYNKFSIMLEEEVEILE